MIVEFVAVEEELVEEPAVQGLPSSLSHGGGSFRFVQEDELEAEAQEAEPGWQDQAEEEQLAEVEVTETITELNVNGHTLIQDTVTITTTEEVCSLAHHLRDYAEQSIGYRSGHQMTKQG